MKVIVGNQPTVDEHGVLKAIMHYEGELKNGKEYARPILEGLYLAKKKLEKYNQIISHLIVE